MQSLFVYMNGYEVGEYVQRSNGTQEFNYFKSWLQRDAAIPLSLSLPLTSQSHKGEKVYNYFDNLLPDSINIRNRIQAKFGAKTNQAFDLLYHIGQDCVGAIQMLSEHECPSVKRIEGSPMSDAEIAKELKLYRTLPLGMSKGHGFRISLAGAQEKTGLLRYNDQWMRPIGVTPTTHILKLPIGRIEYSGIDLSDSVENEWLCLEILRQFGMPVPMASIQTFVDQKVLIVERFDRKYASNKSWIIRYPVEDMCQASGIAGGLKYESDGGPGIHMIMELLKSSLNPEADRKQFMQTIFLFWMLGAIDGHAKNFSIFLRAGGRFKLTPIYDVISAYPIVYKKKLSYQKMKMAMALSGKNKHYHWQSILSRHWFVQAEKVDFPKSQMEMIFQDVASKADAVMSRVCKILPKDFPGYIAESILTELQKAVRSIT